MAKRRLWRYGVMALMAVLATQAAPPSAAQARSREHAWGETRHAQPDASPVPLQCDDRKFLADVEAAESTTGSHATGWSMCVAVSSPSRRRGAHVAAGMDISMSIPAVVSPSASYPIWIACRPPHGRGWPRGIRPMCWGGITMTVRAVRALTGRTMARAVTGRWRDMS